MDFADDLSPFPITLAGEVDIAQKPHLDELAEQYRRSDQRSVDVDLSDVDFMDSTGLGFLIGLRREAALRGGTVALTDPSPKCMRLLDLVAVPTLFDIRSSPLAGVDPARVD